MNGFDWILLAVLAYSTVAAFMRGLVREIFGLVGLVAGILLASWNYPWLAQRLGRLITTASIANVVAFLLIAIGIMVLAAILGKLLHRTADAIGLGFFDRLAGAGFGLIRGCLLGVAILMAALAFLPQNAWTKNSRFVPYFLAGAHAVSFVVPHDLQQQIRKGAEELKHTAPGWIKPHS
ncbi:CvpA family protein [Edaphobacter bradus]|uniref:CvpA family protein n=1 Tax=Edaphobacter bradus TaxID=2259016 RepID=UPI0021E00439|nr:CvpA family protein [Edaphobacter bradus]